jgi:hypothetical protein
MEHFWDLLFQLMIHGTKTSHVAFYIFVHCMIFNRYCICRSSTEGKQTHQYYESNMFSHRLYYTPFSHEFCQTFCWLDLVIKGFGSQLQLWFHRSENGKQKQKLGQGGVSFQVYFVCVCVCVWDVWPELPDWVWGFGQGAADVLHHRTRHVCFPWE